VAVSQVGYLSFVLLLDVREEGGIGEVPFAARTSKLPLRLLLILGRNLMILTTLFLTHQ
jgi:hypothetical protein